MPSGWNASSRPASATGGRSGERDTDRRLVAKIGGDAAAKAAAERRERNAEKTRQTKILWLDKAVPTSAVEKFAGASRNALYKRFGPRGTPRFGKVTR